MNTKALVQWFDQRAASHHFSGVVLIWRDGAPIFEYGGGIAHRGHLIPITNETRFGVASVTKMVTATTVLRLVDRGELRLDQPLIEILPPEHTLHHLLSHTSGLPNYHDDAAQTWDSFVGALDRIPGSKARRPADMLPLFSDLPAERPPGEKYLYSDANFILAGLVIEAATGKSFYDVATEEVLRPAGMADTAFDELDQDPPRYATGYLHADGPPDTWRSNVFSLTGPAGSSSPLPCWPLERGRVVAELTDGRIVGMPLSAVDRLLEASIRDLDAWRLGRGRRNSSGVEG